MQTVTYTTQSDEDDENENDNADDDDLQTQNASHKISLSLDAEHLLDNGKDGDEYDRFSQGQTFISMELQLMAMNEKVVALMNEVNELRERNNELETSKLRLIETTATAMNECKETIKNLSIHNDKLLAQINRN